MTPTLRDATVRVIRGKVTLRGLVSGHDEHEDGDQFETPPLTILNLAEMTAATKTVTYKIEGEIK
jgi:hypothetical protein